MAHVFLHHTGETNMFWLFLLFEENWALGHINLNLFNPLKISTVVLCFLIWKIRINYILTCFFHFLQIMSFLFVMLGSSKWHHSTSSTTCPLVKAKKYCKTCWTQMHPENVKSRNKKPPQSAAMPAVMPAVAVQWCRRLTTDVWFNDIKP